MTKFKRFLSSKTVPKVKRSEDEEPSYPRAGDDSLPGSASTSTLVLPRGRAEENLSAHPKSASIRTLSPNPALSSFGLQVVYQPDDLCSIDIVFVHGLAGDSRKTWTKGGNDATLFWPENWLPFEPDLGTARISTFGYNAAWKGASKSISRITDFAKELLYELRFAKDQNGAELGMGKRPIIFVVHSMGGLVVKKAYLMGLHDETYKNIVLSTSAIIFLSTPHRGTNLAETLNHIISATLQSPKSFLSDLAKSSFVIEELNEQFRHFAPDLSIWSFYETLATSIGPKKVMVLEKDSSVLGYPSEISRPLQADHQNICKYTSPSDANYISIRNAIKSLVSLLRSQAQIKSTSKEVDVTMKVKDVFRNTAILSDDLRALQRQWMPGTCHWLFENTTVQTWMNSDSESSICWYSAPPASGKSVLSAFAATHLQDTGLSCQYYFFRDADRTKSSAASALKSIAFQMVKSFPACAEIVSSLPKESLAMESEDVILLWQSLIAKILSVFNVGATLYWVFDGLDECRAPKDFIKSLSLLESSAAVVKVLLVSRNTNAIAVALDRVSRSVPVARVEANGNSSTTDISIYVDDAIEHVGGSDQFKKDLRQTMIARCGGNFLWTKLVLEEIMECYTEESIQEVLDGLSEDMYSLYERMEESLLGSIRKSNVGLSRTILEWTICSHRALTLPELSQALQPEYSRIMDLRRTIKDTCGQFVQIGRGGKLTILHHTAKEYLTNTNSRLYVDEKKVNGKILQKLLSVLRPDLRSKLMASQRAYPSTDPFILYSATSWPYHLGQCHGNGGSDSTEILDSLSTFFEGPAVLAWIHALSLVGRIDVMRRASRAVTSFASSVRKKESHKNPLVQRIGELELLDKWALDMAKIVGRFGRYLAEDPDLAYDLMPSLCPGKTAISELCYDDALANVQVSGMSHVSWSDNVSRIALQDGQIWGILTAGRTVTVMMSTGKIRLLSSVTFASLGSINHGEPVTAMALTANGSKLATYGLKNTKMWEVTSGALLLTISNPLYTKAMHLVFANDQKLLMGGDDNITRESTGGEWTVTHSSFAQEFSDTEGKIANTPMCLAFSPDQKHVGVCYRGAPLSVWRLSDGKCVNKCRRTGTLRINHRRPSAGWFAVNRFTWNPVTGHILGIYKDGCVFKWHPLTDEAEEVHRPADEIATSPTGKLFVTSSSDGSVRVWDFGHFSVIYQLSSEDLVTGLHFSPDGLRFYDVRSNVLNAWEPSCVSRFDEYQAQISDSNSEALSSEMTFRLSEEHVEAFEAVTALAVAPFGSVYLAGFEDGAVFLHDIDNDKDRIEFARFDNFCDVNHIVWSSDGRYVAMADVTADIQIMATEQNGRKITPLVSPKIALEGDNITDLIFGPERLLVVTHRACYICSLKDGSLLAQKDFEGQEDRRWLTFDGSLFSCTAGEVKLFDWDLGLVDIVTLESPLFTEATSRGIDRATVSTDLRRIILECSDAEGRLSVAILRAATSTADRVASILSRHAASVSFNASQLPSRISRHVRKPLGLISATKFAFLDHDMWFSVYNVESVDTTDLYQRFYFVPQHWVGTHTLSNTVYQHDGEGGCGVLFMPKEDRVLRIRCNLEFARSFSRYDV